MSSNNSNIFLSRLKRRIFAHLILARVAISILIISVILLLGALLFHPVAGILDNVLFIPKMTLSFLFGSPSLLENTGGRTNVLLLGAGGAGHEAPELTDTIIFFSFGGVRGKPVFVSLPRDIWIPTLRAKLNTAYYYGNQKKEGGGIILAKASVSEIFDQPVHYAAVLDFSGFIKLVDTLGGIDIEVERTFDDFKYPIPGRENDDCGGADSEFKCRYEHLHFEQGKQIMKGEAALKFVRSRNAQGEEGTDFARSSRQQKVIEAIKKKILSPLIILNPPKIRDLWIIATSSLKTDIPQDKIPIILRMYLTLDKNKLQSVVLDGGGKGDSQTGFLVNPPLSAKYDHQWVLVPRDEDWEEVRKWVDGFLY